MISDRIERHGHGEWRIYDPGLVLVEYGFFDNIITDLGIQFYSDRAALTPSPPAAASGMQLGTNSAPATKSGAGAAIGTYIAGSSIGFEVGYPASSFVGGTTRRMQWKATWVAGVATSTTIREVALINQAITTDAAAPVGNVISRALTGTINKGALQILQMVWNHDA